MQTKWPPFMENSIFPIISLQILMLQQIVNILSNYTLIFTSSNIYILLENYTKIRCPCHCSLFLYTEYHLARRRGEISYKEGIKADNFRINSGISKHCIIPYHQWIDRCSANMNIIKWCAYNSRPLSVIFLPYNTEQNFLTSLLKTLIILYILTDCSFSFVNITL